MIGRALGGPGCNRQILNLAALPIDFGSRGSQGSTGHVWDPESTESFKARTHLRGRKHLWLSPHGGFRMIAPRCNQDHQWVSYSTVSVCKVLTCFVRAKQRQLERILQGFQLHSPHWRCVQECSGAGADKPYAMEGAAGAAGAGGAASGTNRWQGQADRTGRTGRTGTIKIWISGSSGSVCRNL